MLEDSAVVETSTDESILGSIDFLKRFPASFKEATDWEYLGNIDRSGDILRYVRVLIPSFDVGVLSICLCLYYSLYSSLIQPLT